MTSKLPAPAPRAAWLAGWCRRAVLGRLRRLVRGSLVLEEPGRATQRLVGRAPGVAAHLCVTRPTFWRDVALGGTLGAGESYLAGHWRSDDLVALVQLFVQNRDVMLALEGGLARLAEPLRWWYHRRNRNDRRGSRRNIAAHYDLGDELFALFLDDSMTYSSAFFARTDMSLAEAQQAKIARLCQKLDLRPGEHLLEIGSGWGAFAVQAAGQYGCRVTTTTISPAQSRAARARVQQHGLSALVDVRTEDYRDLRGRFDKLVSVEMIEAVGHRHLGEFLRCCGELLQPHGCLALQAITIADQNYAAAVRAVDFIKRYVFPGSFIPSVTAIVDAATATSDLRLVHLEDLGAHYVLTLRQWRERFLAQRAAVLALGYGERFVRLWEFYLAYCEAGFRERYLSVVQMVFAKPQWRGEVRVGESERSESARTIRHAHGA